MVGSGVFAGGPYDCAEGDVSMAFDACMYAVLGLNPEKYIQTTKTRSGSEIDTYNYMSDDKIYMFSGTKDTTVNPKVMDALQTYYEAFLSKTNISYMNTLDAAHTFPTDDPTNKNACTKSATPYISYCAYDGAGKALNQIYAGLKARNDGALLNTIEFDQTEFLGPGHSFASTGYAYVPKACADGERCKLHISFHGCAQNYQFVGMDYVTKTGFNKWADTNNIIVVYPQTVKDELLGNPEGCWDWWGYDHDAKTYDTYTGPQQIAIKAIMDRIGSGMQ